VVHVPSGSGRTPHRHPASAEVIFVARGRGHVWREERRHEVQAGDLVLVPAGLAHATIPEDGTDMDLVCFFPVPSLAGNVEELLDVRIDPDGDGDEIASETGR
jgi:quercetin dioxygenase-like cupin family protein